ncbi:MAG: hypothetical protein WBZ36_12255 [Candidatus Nitrosopolaris sp.]
MYGLGLDKNGGLRRYYDVMNDCSNHPYLSTNVTVVIKNFTSLQQVNDCDSGYDDGWNKYPGRNGRKYRLIDVDGKEITPRELAKKYFSSPEVCFIKADETLREEELVAIRATISNNLLYSQSIRHKITPPACNNILTELYNNRIEDSEMQEHHLHKP